jgi:hypothetical protein
MISRISRFDPMMFEACTNMLYRALATVLVLTEPAFRDVMATWIAYTHGPPTMSVASVYFAHLDASAGRNSDAINSGNTYI